MFPIQIRCTASFVGLALLASTARISTADDEFTTGSSDPLIRVINEQIRAGYADNEVEPSPVADDYEWLRRVYLDLVGQVPDAQTIREFVENEDPAKRSRVIEQLLDDPQYVRNMTTIWTNLLLGRNTPDRTSRPGMEKFLRECFARNRPWNEIVFDMLTAEGHFEENGAVNFLLGQLQGNPRSEDYTVEATAKATRLFLGMQVQCTQCHNHPFNDWKQDQFWQFDSLFKQMVRRDVDRYDPESGQNVDDYSELVWRDYSGAVYYETRAAVMEVAYPTYFDHEIDYGAQTNRRLEFAEIACHQDPNQQLAQAFVNRMWGHFFGYGFTRPVDDIGPHNPPSHPELLATLSDEFVKSGYDIKQLVTWICNSEAYNLTSRFSAGNQFDNPSAGEVPLFSHMYVKTMTAEQLYDSLIVATNAHRAGQGGYEQAQQQRERWMQDFLRIFGGNEEDEPTLFSGSIPQALMMMNGELVRSAVSAEPGSYLNTVLSNGQFRNDSARIQELYISALGRLPGRGEIGELSNYVQASRTPAAKLAAYQDIYWALLNSNEFIVNH